MSRTAPFRRKDGKEKREVVALTNGGKMGVVRGIARVYTCDICDRRESWHKGWAQYGSLRDSEDHGLNGMVLTCSDACRRLFDTARGTATNRKETQEALRRARDAAEQIDREPTQPPTE